MRVPDGSLHSGLWLRAQSPRGGGNPWPTGAMPEVRWRAARARYRAAAGRKSLRGAKGDNGRAASSRFYAAARASSNQHGRQRLGFRRRRLWSQTVQRLRCSQKERTPPALRHHASSHRFRRKEIRVARDRRHPGPVETNRVVVVRQHSLSAPERGQPGRDRLAHGDSLALHDPRAGVLPRPDGRCRSNGRAHARKAARIDLDLAGRIPASLRHLLLAAIPGPGRGFERHGRDHSPAHARPELRRLLEWAEPMVHLALTRCGGRPPSRRALQNARRRQQPDRHSLDRRLRLPRACHTSSLPC